MLNLLKCLLFFITSCLFSLSCSFATSLHKFGHSPRQERPESNSMEDVSSLKIGFLGTGKIGSAVARGYASCPKSPASIIVSPRSADKAAALAADYPNLVKIAQDNAQVVAESDIIFIGLLPGTAREIIPSLPFTEKHFVVSMMAAVDYTETLSLLQAAAPSLPDQQIVRTVPLPAAAKRSGPILMHPINERGSAILKNIGTPVSCKGEEDMKPMICLTGHISSFFELQRVTESWITSKGVDSEAASAFVRSFYSSLATAAENSEHSLADMRDEAATPGGLNEQSVQTLTGSEHFHLQEKSLQDLLNRLGS